MISIPDNKVKIPKHLRLTANIRCLKDGRVMKVWADEVPMYTAKGEYELVGSQEKIEIPASSPRTRKPRASSKQDVEKVENKKVEKPKRKRAPRKSTKKDKA